jgi:hypothetical protein
MTSHSFSEYFDLSPRDRVLADCLYWKKFTDPGHRRFLAGLFRIALTPEDPSEEERLLAPASSSLRE